MEIIRMSGIDKSYGKKSVETKVLHQVNLTVEKGEFVSLFGKSGCGKTTLLNIIGLLDSSDRGKYYLELPVYFKE